MALVADLIGEVREVCASMPDKRRGQNARYPITDFGMAAFASFFAQSPSFLSFQRRLSAGAGRGRSNCESLMGMSRIPCDNHIRDMLDPVDPRHFYPVFDTALVAVEVAGALPQGLNGHTLIAFDATQYFCSKKLNCPQCSHRKRSDGSIDYYHVMLAASIVVPGHNWALPLPPEFVTPQDGHKKQDCENRAAHRWLAAHGQRYQHLNPVYLGDDLYSNQPLCEAILAGGGSFLFVCKPDSHPTLEEYVSRVKLPAFLETVRRGKKKHHHCWRWMEAVPIRDGEDALNVNWLELEIKDDKGHIVYRNSFVTNLPVNADTVVDLAKAGRARWKIENETFNVLKTKGYNLEHNFGHGSQHLASVLATLNLLAFAIHTAADLVDQRWKDAVAAAGSRRDYFDNLRALTSYHVFPSWDYLLDTLAFKVEPPPPPP